MNFFKKTLLTASLLGGAVASSSATLVNFTDYNLGGTTASWDIFDGENYLPQFNFSTADTGNSILNYTGNLTMTATVPGWTAGQVFTWATGPTDSDGATIPGNRELFYTFFASQIDWNIAGTIEADVDTIVFQFQNVAGGGGGLSNMTLNGISATPVTDALTDVTTWQWTGLDLEAGDSFTFAWSNTVQHSAFDAFQVQMGVVPEPATIVLAGAGLAVCYLRRRRRSLVFVH